MFVPGIGARVFRMPLAGETQADVFETVVRPLARSFTLGLSGTLFAYGQTGSGKTHSLFGGHELYDGAPATGATEAEHRAAGRDMYGRPKALSAAVARASGGSDPALGTELGVIPRVCAEVLARVNRDRAATWDLSVAFVEIYNERLYNLLTGDETSLSHTGAKRLKSGKITPSKWSLSGGHRTVRSMAEVMALVTRGCHARTAHATAMNERSSRSHAVFVLRLSQHHVASDTVMESTLHLVDLAGSERLKKSKAEGDRFTEMKHINGSLTVLGRCIGALARKDGHIPYADSTLTKMLQPALGGNCVTSMITCLSSDEAHAEESLSSLRFGERTASVTNTVEVERQSVKGAIREVAKQLRSVQHAMDELTSRGRGFGNALYDRHFMRRQILTAQLAQLEAYGGMGGM